MNMKHTKKLVHGFTAIEYVAIVAAIAIATIAVVSASSGFFSSSKKNSAILEVSKIVNAAKLYRIANNDYSAIGIDTMAEDGYDIEPFTDGVAENAYGLDVDIDPVSGNADALMMYDTDGDAACASLKSRYGESADGIATAFCAAGNATTGTVASNGPRLLLTVE
jgi:Tfp pilus assembly protein PilE